MRKNILRKIGWTIITIFFLLSMASMLDGKLINSFLLMLLGTASMGIMDRHQLL